MVKAQTSVERLRIAGVPLSSWAFALRTWAAMLVALFMAFWLQLDTPSSTAVTVAILAQPRRGQAFNKAFYRFGATLIGFVASIVIMGLFTQARDLFMAAFAAWMALAVYVASCYDGTRAYGAVLSGYTVSIVAVTQIDNPQDVFTTGIARVAVISLGIASVAVISDIFAAPNVYPTVRDRLVAAQQATRNLVCSLLSDRNLEPASTVETLRQIVGIRLDILTLGSEGARGAARREAAKSAAAAMVGSIFAARSMAIIAKRESMNETLVEAFATNDHDAIATALDAEMAKVEPSPNRVMLFDCGLHLVERLNLADEEIQAMLQGARPCRRLRLPIHRDREYARRSALRVFVTICIASILFIQSGWPLTSVALSQIGVFAGLSATNTDPSVTAKQALIAMPIAAIASGVTEFLILDGTDQFPLFAIAIAPAVWGACFAILHPKWGGIGFFVLVYFPVFFPPSNPQDYSPLIFIYNSLLTTTAVFVFLLLVVSLFPTSDRDRRRWMVNAARRDLLVAITGSNRYSSAEATYLAADRIAVLSRFKIGGQGGRKWRLNYTLLLSNLTNAALRASEALEEFERRRLFGIEVAKARGALGSLRPLALREAASSILCAARFADRQDRLTCGRAAASLQISALLIEDYASTLRHLRWALDT